MRTDVLSVDPISPQPEVIARAADVIRRGGLVAFPTETVYGLGANAMDANAVARIFDAKDRPVNNPIIVHIGETAVALRVVSEWPPIAAILAGHFWPGPLTLVLPRQSAVADIVTAGGPTVAVRVPAHPVARALIQTAGLPIAAPSANPSNRLSPTFAEHVLEGLDGRIDLVLDGGPAAGGLESTVLDLTHTLPRILRPGLVTRSQLERVIGPVQGGSLTQAGGAPLASPGMLPQHYAPRTPLKCVANDSAATVKHLSEMGQRVAWLVRQEGANFKNVERIKMPEEAPAYAAVLFAVLHDIDKRGLDQIVVDMPPDADEWTAVRDRLLRASLTSFPSLAAAGTFPSCSMSRCRAVRRR